MGKGGKGKILIPSDYGYGASAIGEIPAHSVLIFDIVLSDFQ
ncbi:MAG: FKBP-type peptidyl-prolyl cis-trans isomerase [Bacteroidales bacterium]|nr:FKBP-type peptidyl-prolyl cis-trans isomerase [Bacteroidales bacterium]